MANIKVVSPEGRFRFLTVYSTKEDMKGNPVREATVLIPKTSSLAALEKARTDGAMAEFKGKIPGALRRVTGGQKPLLKDGDEYYETRDEDKKEMYKEYRGCWTLSASCPANSPLFLRDENNADIMDPSLLYDGAYGVLLINLSVYSAKARKDKSGNFFPGGPMISVTLHAVRKTRDGEPIDTSSAPAMTEDELTAFFGGASAGHTDKNEDDL